MKISEMVGPSGELLCNSPAHPEHSTRATMYFLEEKNGFFVFGCRTCTETQQRPQFHVIAASHGARKIYQHTRKATSIDRDSKGRIRSFH